MKLYELERQSVFKLKHPMFIHEKTYLFHHVDGMYSYCTGFYEDTGKVFHFGASTEVEYVGPYTSDGMS